MKYLPTSNNLEPAMARKPDSDTGLSPLERMAQLQEEMELLRDEAKAQALESITAGIELLNKLGYRYRLTEGDVASRKSPADGTRKTARRISPDRVCPICQFRTEPAHDARAHRSQRDDKRPFTLDELMELDLKRLD